MFQASKTVTGKAIITRMHMYWTSIILIPGNGAGFKCAAESEFYICFPKQRRHDWGGVLTCLLEKYLADSGFPVVADLPRLA